MKIVLTHVRINVSDVIKASKWYKETMGFEVSVRYPEDKPYYIGFESKGGANVTVVEELHTTPYGVTKFTIADPDGNELGFNY